VREELRNALANLTNPVAPKAYVSSGELMTLLSVSRGTLRGMMREGLPHTKPGKFPRFSVAEVETWLAARRAGQSA
jgi:excisionase family DNA binding protein